MLPDPAVCLPPPHPACRFIVGIPAKDEAARVGACLGAFARQRCPDGSAFPREAFELILLANNCADATAAIARATAGRHPGLRVHVVEAALPAESAHVGTARRWVMDAASRRFTGNLRRPSGIIATTDADTRVAPNWLGAIEGEIARGVEAVGGYVRACAQELARLPAGLRAFGRKINEYHFLVARLESALDPNPHDPWPRHFHHNGASFAVTARAYAHVGGMPALPALEDMEFYSSLVRHDMPVRHSPAVRVVTSARTVGRTPLGMAVTIGEWIAALRAGRPPCLVESPAAIERRVARRQALRRRWLAADSRESFGAFSARMRPAAASARVEVDAAIAALRRRLGLAKIIPVFSALAGSRRPAAENIEPVFRPANAA